MIRGESSYGDKGFPLIPIPPIIYNHIYIPPSFKYFVKGEHRMNNLEKELLRTLNEANEFMFDKGDWIKSFGIDSVLPSLAKYFARVAILKHAVDMDETESYSDEKSRLRDSTNDFINAFYKIESSPIITDHNELTQSHFVTFRTSNANEIEKILAQNNIIVDSRGDRLRFGFGLYHDLKDIDALVEKMKEILT